MTDEQPAKKPRLSPRAKWAVRVVVFLALLAVADATRRYAERVQTRIKRRHMQGVTERYVIRWLPDYARLQRKFRADREGKEQDAAYARPFTVLCVREDDNADGTEPRFYKLKDGGRCGYYIVQDMDTVGGRAVDSKRDFALCATPEAYGRSSRRTFIIKTDGTVWCKDLGRSQIVKDFPLDPAADGWKVVVRSAPEVAKESK